MAGPPPIPNPNVPLPKGFHPGSPGTSQPVYNNNAMWNLPSNPEDKYSSGQPVWANQGTPHQPGYQILEDGGYYPPPGQGTQPVQMQQFTSSPALNTGGQYAGGDHGISGWNVPPGASVFATPVGDHGYWGGGYSWPSEKSYYPDLTWMLED